MPQEKDPPDQNASESKAASGCSNCALSASANLPCEGAKAFRNLRFMPRCLNCRREVEGSMSRIGGRQLRKLRAAEGCSAEECAAFLEGVQDDAMRLHMASMAWWRFSAAGENTAGPVLRVLSRCRAKEPGSGMDYMHRALRVLSPLSQAQLAVWFGCETLYHAAAIFSGDRPAMMGKHCHVCRLYKLGCDTYDRIGADDCVLWKDPFVQGVADVVKKAGGRWNDPCAGMGDDGKEIKA